MSPEQVQVQAPTGTRDVLPPESSRWQALIARFATLASGAGYGLIQGPMFEDIEVFKRVGEATDVVKKEMYDFEDKGGRHLALRPEGTAGVVRAFVQHRPTTPWKVWYASPNFRYERPQAGRYRQHHQLGVEALGTDDPDLDVEVISIAHDLYKSIGLTRVTLLLNSLGDATCRPPYNTALTDFLLAH
ncbi:MAG TPA: ATP phosphoribosyltransferase regulatory subunit, partial [Acidimicrobiales bacterium]|nr:ATP phosphoribosyltransferase regulatory subunit [Acidimicrobiales bacterium]